MRLYTDASHDDGVIGLAYVVKDETSNIDIEGKRYTLGEYTSMSAEYTAMMCGVHAASWYGGDTLVVQTDCKPLVDKMNSDENGVWGSRRDDFNSAVSVFDAWEINHVSREYNERADRLAREALWLGREERN